MRKLVLLFFVLMLSSSAYAAEGFTVDPRHTYATFEVNHMGLSTQRGRFNTAKGRITLDRVEKKGSMEVEIDAKTVNTGLEELQKHLRSEDFFNVEKFPTITFKSDKMEFEGDKPKAVQGELTLLGVTKPVTLAVSSFDCRIHPMNKKYVCGADAAATIKRSDFGMSYALPAVSDDVRLIISVEAFRD